MNETLFIVIFVLSVLNIVLLTMAVAIKKRNAAMILGAVQIVLAIILMYLGAR